MRVCMIDLKLKEHRNEVDAIYCCTGGPNVRKELLGGVQIFALILNAIHYKEKS